MSGVRLSEGDLREAVAEAIHAVRRKEDLCCPDPGENPCPYDGYDAGVLADAALAVVRDRFAALRAERDHLAAENTRLRAEIAGLRAIERAREVS